MTLGSTRASVAVAQKKAKKHVHALAPLAVAGVLLSVVALGHNQTNPSGAAARQGGFGGGNVSVLDELSAADVAANIANGADLLVADNVQNLADSQKAQVEFSGTDGSYVSKPQQVVTDVKTNTDIVDYVVQNGDTVDRIARRFNVTSDTIKWENNLASNSVAVGRTLKILPVSGIRYTVKDGDTPQSIADRYRVKSVAYLIAFNDAELRGFKDGDKIIIPDGKKPAPAQSQTFFSSGYGFSFGSQPLYGGNGYSYGYCTWHAANRRIQIGREIPRNLGNAVTWATLAGQAGLGVGSTPKDGAVIWHRNTWIAGGLGHVGFVEKVNADGTIRVSDMNYPYWNVVTYRTISPSEFGQYLFVY